MMELPRLLEEMLCPKDFTAICTFQCLVAHAVRAPTDG